MTKSDKVTGEILDHKGRRLNELGQELPDPTVMDPPIGYIAQPPLHELIRQMVVSEQLRLAAEAEGLESFDDADDFDVDDEQDDPSSPWEENFEGASAGALPSKDDTVNETPPPSQASPVEPPPVRGALPGEVEEGGGQPPSSPSRGKRGGATPV